MYRPKFCTECGAKIIRLRWRAWTSRRFCAHCAPRFAKEQITQVAVVGATLLLIGLALGYAERRVTPPLLIARNQDSTLARTPTPPKTSTTTSGMTTPADDAGANADTPNVSSSQSADVIYMCGARTKRGTPCTRRVHGLVRCWQHKGMPAMLPPEKLVIR
jgi:hypothetical protein